MPNHARTAGRLVLDRLLSRIVFRATVHGRENLPDAGGVLLVSNHVTMCDALLVRACLRRSIRCVVSRDTLAHRLLAPLARRGNFLFLSPADDAATVASTVRAIRDELDRGRTVCVFAEGALTRNGLMRAFLPGLEPLWQQAGVPVLPVYIDAAWGHVLSYAPRPRRRSLLSPRNISVLVGPSVADRSSTAIRQAIRELSCQAFERRKHDFRTLPYYFIRSARANRFKLLMTDTTGKEFRFGQALTATLALAAAVRSRTAGHARIGILLPPSTAAALTNYAVTLNGQAAVNLNMTVSAQAMASAIRQCDIRTIISSRAVLEHLGDVGIREGLVFLEDIVSQMGLKTRICAALQSVFTPAHRLAARSRGPDEIAAILFSSGSTGHPKGIQLSHHNLISNIESFEQALHLNARDRMCAALPFFHSFGFTTNLWAPALIGCSAHFHTNPLDGATIMNLLRRKRLTLLLATPTFLLAYLRRGTAADATHLRAVVTGAEKLPQRIADAFEKRFGIRPLEGYGATELAPVASVNVPDVTRNEITQTGTKPGSIGHPIRGVVARIADPDSGDPRDEDQEGLLWIKGPNVMQGYLNDPETTRDVLQDGWYNTGDIARMDRDGFLFIVDRLSRYSKIAGEMVPHLAVEDAIHSALKLTGRVLVVTAAPDSRKGEQLVVCYTPEAGERDALQRIVRDSDLPNLWKPHKDNFVRVADIPHLASGKLDLKQIRQIASEFVARRPTRGQRALDALRNGL